MTSMHWSTEFYRLVDAGDPAAHGMIAQDVFVQVGNHPPTIGLDAMEAGELGRHRRVTRTSVHDTQRIVDVDTDTAMLDTIVTFHRHDGRAVTVPVLTVIRRNAAGQIDMLRLFVDNAPLFDGWAD